MTFPRSVTPPSPRAPRSLLITIFGWVVIVANALLLPISVISFFMVLVGSYGTANIDPLEGMVVILGPPVTLLAGIGLIRRWRWAWAYMLAVLIGLVVWSAGRIIKGPSPAQTSTSANGTRITVSATAVNYPFHGTVIGVGLGLLAFLLSPNVRSTFGVARPRRPVSVLRDVPMPAAGPAMATPVARKHSRGLPLAVIALLAVAGGMGWLVQNGIGKGETFSPAKTGSHRRTVSRSEKPALFWVSIGLYSLVGSGSLGLALWSIREGLKSASKSVR